MESSDAETGMVDCGVGTIVWVRRRNGSWWPGKILGPDELSASHLMSPRSGTPVKLLGREDASVDWYNLEKSKRVKPFRCGEFDECIERAEASQGMPPKKREKYARREDAILHALELEKQVLEKKYGKLGNGLSTKLPGKEMSITPEFSRENGKHATQKTDDDKRKGLSLQSRRADSGGHLNVEDKSLRGLQDLGTGPIPLKYKLSNGSHNKHALAIAADGVRKKLLEKRKRSQEEDMEESVGKRRDRHRPLVQVLQSSAKLPHMQSKGDGNLAVKSEESFDRRDRDVFPEQVAAPKSLPVSLSEDNNTSGSNEDTETDSSGTESLISDTYDAMAALSDEAEHMEFIPKAFGRGGEDESNSDDDSGGVAGDSGDSVATTVSKWQLKGKRNNRSLTKRKIMNSNSSHWMTTAYVDSFDTDMRSRALGGYSNSNIHNWGGTGGGLDDEYPDVSRRMLIDVEVGVQTGYQREHVPMISLMSKLNDKAIVGHPIPVEALEDGSSDIILSQEGYYDDDATLQPWRTARRSTKCRVARPPHLSRLEEEEEEDASFRECYDENGKASTGSVIRSSKGKKWAAAKKPQRRSTASCSSQKIRTLSSIGGSQQQQQQQQQQSTDMKAVAGEEGIGMMKPESLPTAVACIPVKLVFSRLHEELVAPAINKDVIRERVMACKFYVINN